MGSSAFIFGWIFIILASNRDSYKSLNEFEFLSDPITSYWVSCPWVVENWMYNVVRTLAPSFLIGSYSFLKVTRTAIKSWEYFEIRQEEHWSMKFELLLNGSSSFLQVSRKTLMSLIFNHTWPPTIELAALECLKYRSIMSWPFYHIHFSFDLLHSYR